MQIRSSLSSQIGNGFHFLAIACFQLLVLRRASILLGQDYGLFAHLYAVTSIGLSLTLLGLHGTVMRYLAICSARDARATALRILLHAARLRGALIVVIGIGLWFYLSSNPAQWNQITIGHVCIFFALQGFLLLQHAALQGLGLYPWMAIGSACLFFGMTVGATDLASLFRMLSVGYGSSLVVNGVVLIFYFLKRSAHDPILGEKVDGSHLNKFSLTLSVAGLCIMIADNSPIVLLKEFSSPEVFSVLALAFNLALYPSRVNALSEPLILPEVSEAWHVGGNHQARERFSSWVSILHLMGPLLMIPIVLGIGPFIRYFFAPELEGAVFFAMILILANVARVTSPILVSVLVGGGRPGLSALSSAIKMVIDVGLILLLRGNSPEILVVALTCSWVVYINLLTIFARQQLLLPWKLDWFVTLFVLLSVAILFTPIAHLVFASVWFVFLGRAIVRMVPKLKAKIPAPHSKTEGNKQHTETT